MNEFAPNVFEDEEPKEPSLDKDELFDRPIDGQVPTFDGEIKLVTGLESMLEDFDLLLRDMIGAKGMQTSFALEGRRLDADFDSAVPLGYYTDYPTQTRYKPALESAWANIKKYVDRALEMIAKFIRKAVNWFMGLGGESPKTQADLNAVIVDTEKGYDENIQQMSKVAEHAGEVGAAIASGITIRLPDGTTKRYKDPDEFILDAYQEIRPGSMDAIRFLTNPDPFLDDILTGGAYSKIIGEAGQALEDSLSILEAKRSILNQILVKDSISKSLSDIAIARNSLRKISGPITVSFQGKVRDLDNINTLVQISYAMMSRSKPIKHRKFTQVFENLVHVLEDKRVMKVYSQYANMALKLNELSDGIEKLRKAVGNSNTDGNVGAPEAEIASSLREFIAELNRDISSLASVMHQLDAYFRQFNRICDAARGFAARAATSISKFVHPDGTPVNNRLIEAAALMAKIEATEHAFRFRKIRSGN